MITASQQIDRVADSLTHLAKSRVMPAREIKPLVLRLDRIANTLDRISQSRTAGNRASRASKREVHAALQDVESELERLGYEYSVRPGSGITGTVYFVYKNQKDRRKEVQELQDLAERNGGGFDDPAKSSSYRIYITSLEHNK